MTLPRRGPLTPEERLANAVRSQPVNTADGGILTRHSGRRTPTAPLPVVPDAAGGWAVLASATFGPTGTVALGDSISMDGTPQESHGDWGSYFDASSGVVTLLADGLYGFDAYVQGGSGFLANGGLGLVGFAGYKGPAVVISGQVWGQTHSGPAQWSASDTWSMTTASVLNATDGIHANVWCQVYAYGPA